MHEFMNAIGVVNLIFMINKANWPAGEWHDEPDREEWHYPVTGYHCLARRNEALGFWCRYAGKYDICGRNAGWHK